AWGARFLPAFLGGPGSVALLAWAPDRLWAGGRHGVQHQAVWLPVRGALGTAAVKAVGGMGCGKVALRGGERAHLFHNSTKIVDSPGFGRVAGGAGRWWCCPWRCCRRRLLWTLRLRSMPAGCPCPRWAPRSGTRVS